MEKKYLSLEESAEFLGVSTQELNKLREQGEIRGFADRGSWKFRRDTLEEYRRGQETSSDPEVPIYDESGPSASDLFRASGRDSSDRLEQPAESEEGDEFAASEEGAEGEVSFETTGSSDSSSLLSGGDSGIFAGEPADEGVLLDASDDDSASFDAGQDSGIALEGDSGLVAGDDSGIALEGDSGVESTDESGIALESDSGIALDSGSGTGPAGGDSGIALEDEESGIALDGGDSGIALEGGDSGIALEGGDSGIALDGGDSGIALDGGDSGIALDEGAEAGGPADVAGTQQMERPEQGSADSGEMVEADATDRLASPFSDEEDAAADFLAFEDEDEAGADSQTVMKTGGDLEDEFADEEFGDADFGDADFDSDEFAEADDELLVEDEFGEDEELFEEADEFGEAEEAFGDEADEWGEEKEYGAPRRPAAAAGPKWGADVFAGLLVALVVMCATSLLTWDSVRKMWTGTAPESPLDGVTKSLTSFVE